MELCTKESNADKVQRLEKENAILHKLVKRQNITINRLINKFIMGN